MDALETLLIPAGESAKFVSLDDARNLINAALFAQSKKKSFTVTATIRWDRNPTFDPSPRSWINRQGRLLERMSRWLERNNQPVHHAWAREVSQQHRICHTHVLLRLHPDLWGEFRSFMLETGGFLDGTKPFDPVVIKGGDYGGHTPYMKAGAMKYLLKGMDITETFRDPTTGKTVKVMDALVVDNRGEERLPLAGMRIGVSRTLNRQARAAAGWRERVTIKELRAALNP